MIKHDAFCCMNIDMYILARKCYYARLRIWSTHFSENHPDQWSRLTVWQHRRLMLPDSARELTLCIHHIKKHNIYLRILIFI